ncbi:response regulator [Variovorax sp.]|uniref:response regulator n=1 Tax=Variovorax sp. TaxID=1871043 RepID=UPI002D373BB3|nr:response regulator [Variovorax sp.]HYP85326.1 response regulator [Variovorax sp.]
MPLTTVLIEDNPTIRDNLIAAMRELVGVEVVAVAATPAEAIDALDSYGQGWHLAIVDLFLKGGSGMAVLRRFQRRGAGQRMVVLTNYPTPEVRQRCIELGADAVFDKSTELDDFFGLCMAYAAG